MPGPSSSTARSQPPCLAPFLPLCECVWQCVHLRVCVCVSVPCASTLRDLLSSLVPVLAGAEPMSQMLEWGCQVPRYVMDS